LASIQGIHGHHKVQAATAQTTISGIGGDGNSVPAPLSGQSSNLDIVFKGAGNVGSSAGNETIGGVANDTIVGDTGNAFIDASEARQSVVGGSIGNETIWGGGGDTINGGTGANISVGIGGTAGDTILAGGDNASIHADRGNQSIVGGSGNAIIWGSGGDTIQGAAAAGFATIAFGAGRLKGQQETLWDNGTSSGGNDTVVNFTHSIGDQLSLNGATDNPNTVLASATEDNGGNAVLHLSDGSSITLIGVSLSSLTTSYFTTH